MQVCNHVKIEGYMASIDRPITIILHRRFGGGVRLSHHNSSIAAMLSLVIIKNGTPLINHVQGFILVGGVDVIEVSPVVGII